VTTGVHRGGSPVKGPEQIQSLLGRGGHKKDMKTKRQGGVAAQIHRKGYKGKKGRRGAGTGQALQKDMWLLSTQSVAGVGKGIKGGG